MDLDSVMFVSLSPGVQVRCASGQITGPDPGVQETGIWLIWGDFWYVSPCRSSLRRKQTGRGSDWRSGHTHPLRRKGKVLQSFSAVGYVLCSLTYRCLRNINDIININVDLGLVISVPSAVMMERMLFLCFASILLWASPVVCMSGTTWKSLLPSIVLNPGISAWCNDLSRDRRVALMGVLKSIGAPSCLQGDIELCL